MKLLLISPCSSNRKLGGGTILGELDGGRGDRQAGSDDGRLGLDLGIGGLDVDRGILPGKNTVLERTGRGEHLEDAVDVGGRDLNLGHLEVPFDVDLREKVEPRP